MDRNEFISILRASLSGKVPEAVVADNVRYYDNYISQEIASGKSEQEVLASLGDPRLIARTIADTQGETEESYVEYRQDSSDSQPRYQQAGQGNWFQKALVIVLLILIVSAVFSFLSWILPIVLPVLLIVWLVRTIFRNR